MDTKNEFKTCFNEIYKTKPAEVLTFHKVPSVVNSVKNDTHECIMDLEEYKKKQH